jgi:formyl-CoA transferase
MMSVTGAPGQGPMRAGAAISDVAAGLYCAIGILTALLERNVTGVGRWVQVSLLGAQVGMLDFQAARWLMDHKVPEQAGNDHPTGSPMGLFRTRDGHVNIGAAGQEMFRRLCTALGRQDLYEDQRFRSGGSRVRNRESLSAEVNRATEAWASADLIEALNEAGVPCGPVYSLDQTFEDPHVKTMGLAARAEHPTKGPVELVGQPVAFAGSPFVIRSAAPSLGEHTDETLRGLGLNASEIAALKTAKVVA